jgi:diguanylate cyclase
MTSNPNARSKSSKTNSAPTAMAKVAAFMQRMNIECTPANFELLFAVVSGQNEELRTEFGQLDRNIRQHDLDILIRKHIPHHVEDDVASESIDTVGDELTKFMDLVKSESSSLEKFDKVLKQQTQTLSDPANVSPEKLKSTISNISAATEQKMEEGRKIKEAVSAQVQRLDKVATELSNFKQQKFTDPLTGLPNRRAFNKEMLAIYANEQPKACTMVMIEIDAFNHVKDNLGPLIADKFIVHVGNIIKESCSAKDYLARASDTQFAFIFDSISEKSVESIVNKFRHAIAKTPLMNATNGKPIGNVTISGGVCGSNTATGTGDILAKTEAALELSKKKKGNQVTLFEERKSGDTDLERNAWSLYNETG